MILIYFMIFLLVAAGSSQKSYQLSEPPKIATLGVLDCTWIIGNLTLVLVGLDSRFSVGNPLSRFSVGNPVTPQLYVMLQS